VKKEKDKEDGSKTFSWVLWECAVPVTKEEKEVKVRVRCFDDKGYKQDKIIENLYNFRGVMNNAPHQITIGINHC
jgi:hypothetical protein